MIKKTNFGLLFCLVYFTSYITRVNYSAAVIDIAQYFNIENSIAGIPVSLSFFSYGIWQIVAGYLGDKYNSVKIITLGMFLTACMNLAVVFSSSIYFIMLFWTINGIAQALLWPPLVKIMLSVFDGTQYKTVCANVIISASIATVCIYLLTPLCIYYFNYKLIFAASSAFAFVVLLIWYVSSKNIQLASYKDKTENVQNISISKLLFNGKMLPIIFVIILQGLLRDGITTWMPTFLNELFSQQAAMSILTTTTLPVFSIVAVVIVRNISKKTNNEILLATYIWSIALASAIILFLFTDNIIIAVATLTILSSCMHGTNLLLIGNLPAKFVKYGRISTISGALNLFTYIGSTISVYGMAKLSEISGWKENIVIWLIVALLGTVFCYKRIDYGKNIK